MNLVLYIPLLQNYVLIVQHFRTAARKEKESQWEHGKIELAAHYAFGHLVRDVNRAFRETFAGPIWTTLRREYEAPDPLPGTDTSDIEWMKLLFGGSGCRGLRLKSIYGGRLTFQTDKKLVLGLVLPTSSWNTTYYPHSQIMEVIKEIAMRRAKGKKKGTMKVEVQKYAAERRAYLEEWSKNVLIDCQHNNVCAEWMKAQSEQRKMDAKQIGRERVAA
ncbi:hypothetical protein MPER_08528 [Moniliophthora perniciosa FA553]|nr:hypothetical protein MPER_08528 [Moniliophthora perniciosa FA553]